MNGLGVIQRQNAQVGLNELREKYVGRWVEASPVGDPDTLVQGTVQDVLINNNRYEYQLAGKVGHFVSPMLVPEQAATA